MCGIAGFNFEDSELIKKMVEILRHRGPDDCGIYTDTTTSLGQARLSIIDLSERGHQPMSNEDSSIWITFNGEIYNYIELKKELKHHQFQSNTDTEVIIHLYEEYGLEFLKKLRGMFAFAIYDTTKKMLLLARDHIGKKPLYYFYDGNIFIFSSEIKAILQHNIKREINPQSLFSFLAFQYVPGTETMFKNINKLLGGHYLIFDLKTKKIKTRNYWDFKEDIISNKTEQYFIKKLENLIEESAYLRLRSDVPVGAFLSGGIDSSIVVAFTRDKISYDFHTFSMGFEYFSELEYAQEVSQHLDTIHHELIITEKDVIKHFSNIAWHYDEPVGDAAVIANYFLSKEARKYVKVVLAGEAGDELFAGYSTYNLCLRLIETPLIPKPARKLLRNILNNLPLSIRGNPWINRNLRRAYFITHVDTGNAHLYTTQGMTLDEVMWLTGQKKPINIYKGIIIPKNINTSLNRMLAIDMKNILPEKYLMKADKATMANSIEERLVLLDKNIIEFSYTVPPELKIKNGVSKWILRKAAEPRLPKKIIWRKKQGFGVPIDAWLKGELRDILLQHLESDFLKNLFGKNLEYIISKVKQRKIHIYHHALVAWTLFTLDKWHSIYFSQGD